MKSNLWLVLGVCITLFSQFGCSNKVEVIGVWKEIPVVYGVINYKDSINYIRIERAYLPPNQSAFEVAKIPDSLYFDTADIHVNLYYYENGNRFLFGGQQLERVNLADEGIARDSGTFAHSPSYAYKTNIQGKRDMELEIVNRKTGKTYKAFAEKVDAENTSLFTTPSYSKVPNKPLAWRGVNQQGQEVYNVLTVEMSGNGFAAIYDYKFRFHYKEYEVDNLNNPIASTVVEKSIDWRAASDFTPIVSNQTKKNINGESFYRFIGNKLSDVTGTNIRRCAGPMEVIVDGASQSLKNYILARQANEGFVGGLHPSAPYSNIEGGYGVFAVADQLERKDRLSDPRLMHLSILTISHLRDGKFTDKLGFEATGSCY